MSQARRVYETRVTHVRRTPWKRSFVHHSTMWVVDIDKVAPARRPRRGLTTFLTGRVLARDHLDGASGSLRQALERFAEREGFATGTRVLLAAQPRALGYCFNPISVWWCLDASDQVVATVVEVHNTYGDRHAYLLEPASRGQAQVAKAMYVSPFHGVDGTYDVAAPLPSDRLEISVALRTENGARFSASLVGRVLESPPWWSAWASPRDALRIHFHGIRLWLRRLPIQPRPPHRQEALK